MHRRVHEIGAHSITKLGEVTEDDTVFRCWRKAMAALDPQQGLSICTFDCKVKLMVTTVIFCSRLAD